MFSRRVLSTEFERVLGHSKETADHLAWLSYRCEIDQNAPGRVERQIKCIRSGDTVDLTPELQYQWRHNKCEYVTYAVYFLLFPWMPRSHKKKF